MAEPAQIISILTTEQYVLAGTRSTTLADMQQRATMYLTSVSSALVALAFIGQVAKLGTPFVVFAGVMLPTLYVFGFLTFVRTVQTSIEDTVLAAGINRIRHYYVEFAPEIARYFVQSTHDDLAGFMSNIGIEPNRWQVLFATQTSIAFVNSVLFAAFAGLIAALSLGVTPIWAVAAALFAFAASIGVMTLVGNAMWVAWTRRSRPLFPTPDAPV